MPAEAPPAPPAAQPSPAVGENLSNAFSELDALYGQPEPEKPVAETPKPEESKPTEQPKPVEQKPAEQKKPEQPPPKPQPVKAKTLAEAKDMAIERAKKAETELTEWKSKYEQLQKNPPEDPQRKSLSERLEASEKRVKELDEKLRFKAYEETDEYKDKYERPFLNAYTSARTKIAALKVVEGRQVDGEGQVVNEGTTRQATAADFDTLMRISDDDTAAEFANKLFGSKASIALYHRERVQELNSARLQAVEDYRKNGSEREKTFKETSERQNKEIATQVETFWKKHQPSAIEKYPHLFKEVEGDTKGNELLQKGVRMVNEAFATLHRVSDPTLTAEQREKLIESHAAVFNWAMAGPRLAHSVSKLTKELKETKTKLEEFEKTEANGGLNRRPNQPTPGTDMDSVLSSLDKLVTR